MKKTEHVPGRFSNGFILEPTLILFALAILVCTLGLTLLKAQHSLFKASRRSALDLAIVEKARVMAGQKVWKKRCGLSLSASSDTERWQMEGKMVVLKDKETYIEAVYDWESQPCQMKVFYDEGGLIDVEYSK